MSAAQTVLVAITAIAIIGIPVLLVRVWSKHRRRGPRQATNGGTGQDVRVHLPMDDPHWRAHSEKFDASRTKKRRKKIWAAGTAGSVGATGVGCGAGGGCSAGCGGGGCGGGCGGG
jgi:hypothetical protein